MQAFTAILFDLDGTLIDSEPLWMQAVGLALERAGHPQTPAALHALVYGRGWGEIYRDVSDRHPHAFTLYDDFVRIVQGHFADLRATRDLRIPGSVETLIALAAHHAVAIVSGSTRADIAGAITHLQLTPHVQDYIGCEDYALGKPHPAGYLLAAERLGVHTAACLVIEDSPHGISAAKAAGMTCVALCRANGHVRDTSAADYRVHDLRCLLRDGRLCLKGLR